MRNQTQSPHNSRKITAPLIKLTIGCILLFCGLSLLYLNYFLLGRDTPYLWQERLKVLKTRSPEAHENLAKALWVNGNQEEAAWELDLSRQTDVLGTTTTEPEIPTDWLKDASDREAQIAKLDRIVREKPDYRDGILQLAYLWYLQGDDDNARDYVKRALELDPQSEVARSLLEAIDVVNNKR